MTLSERFLGLVHFMGFQRCVYMYVFSVLIVARSSARLGGISGAVVSSFLPLPCPSDFCVFRGKGLTYLHEHNQLHRDVKPSNILLNAQGEVTGRWEFVERCLALSHIRHERRKSAQGEGFECEDEVRTAIFHLEGVF